MKYLFACVFFLFGSLVAVLLIASFARNTSTQKQLQEKMPQKTVSFASSSPGLTPTPTPKPAPITLIFLGDMMFDRHIRQFAEKNGYDNIFRDMLSRFQKVDMVIANLEGPITNNKSVSVNTIPGSPNNYRFTFDPLVASTLADANIRIVSLANNHTLNMGLDGLSQTTTYLQEKNVLYFGYASQEQQDAERVLITTIRGKSFAFIGYNEFLPSAATVFSKDLAYAKTQNPDFIIVFAHWGAEYIETANTTIQNIAHAMIDDGVDLVIGSHPHVVQQNEIYKEKHIYYSLGNAVFDQYFSKETMEGLMVTVQIDVDTNTITATHESIQSTKDGRVMIQ